jgi:23S rRNA G2069 N7-methylase RlmK/C1962 C5-methylase RlmI
MPWQKRMLDSALDEKTLAQKEMLINRLKKRSKHLRKWARRIQADAWRLYDKDIPEIPLLIDVYGDSVAGALYQRPYEKDPSEETKWLSVMIQAISEALDIPEDRIFIKFREHQKGLDQYERVETRGFTKNVSEGGLVFKVNLSDYLDTGLFLDHRKTRNFVRTEIKDKRVLNLFCYTGTFSVYAASGGAREVDSVDMSNTYLDWAAENFALNGFKAFPVNPLQLASADKAKTPFRLIRADVLRFLEEANKQGLRWDYIILDPPTFSNSKKMYGTLDICRDYHELIRSCLSLLSRDGKLLFSSNARGLKLDPALFPKYSVKDIQAQTIDEDFIGKRNRLCYEFSSFHSAMKCS